VGDDSWDCIDIFDMNGNWVNFFWPYDSNGNSASYPEGMKISNGKLYVADAYQDEINVYNVSDVVAQVAQTLGCNYVYAQGTYWNSSTGCTPEDVDVDSSGNMYVADYCSGPTGAIYKIAPDYNYSTEPNEGTDVVAYSTSSAAAVTYNGGYLYNPYGIAVDPTGQHVYATDWSNNVIEVYNGGLTATGFIGDSTSAASTVAGKFDGPWGIRLDNQGNLLVVDNGTSLGYPRVQRLTTGGSVLNILGASTTVSGALYSPAYVAEDSNNNVYVSDENIATIDVYSGK
jgi:hypothetical protein